MRGSLTSDGRPPLDASGLKLQERLTLIQQSLHSLEKKRLPQPLIKLKQIISKDIEQTSALFTPIKLAYDLIHKAADILDNKDNLS